MEISEGNSEENDSSSENVSSSEVSNEEITNISEDELPIQYDSNDEESGNISQIY